MEERRIKPITLTDEESGEVYTLEFNRKTIVMAENAGFDVSRMSQKPMSSLMLLWYYSFIMHHPTMTKEKASKLYDELGDVPDGLVERLIELYNAGATTLSAKNPKATVVL